MARTEDGRQTPVFLYPCRFELCDVKHSRRKSTVEKDLPGPGAVANEVSLPTFEDEAGRRRHIDCYAEYKARIFQWKNRKGPTWLVICKQVYRDAADIFWRNNTFHMTPSRNELPEFVSRMTIAQRRAVRSIALSFIDNPCERRSCHRSATSYEDLLNVRAAERASYLALTDLRSLELCIGMEAGLTASNDTYRGLDPKDYGFMSEMEMLQMWICWIRLLQWPDIEKIDVRVEADTENGTGLLRLEASVQQCSDWEQQVELIIRGRLGELDSKLNFPGSLSSDTASIVNRYG
jgi:hypothetical protein